MFKNLYKQNLKSFDRQETRRKELLQQQKLKRLEQQDEFRQNYDIHNERNRNSILNHKHDSKDKIQLQTSEWLKERPDDLNEWLLVPCPKGQRCLVVAEKGKTKMFSKNKKYRMTFSSFLPGGGLDKSGNGYCVLDCIFNQESDSFYVLDVLYLAISLIECDAEFRFFWLKSKLSEINNYEEMHANEGVKRFHSLETYEIADEENLRKALNTFPLWPENQPQLDGFLFYHKRSQYVFGTTPLVCWLFPFMLPDLLQLSVSSAYETPDNYCSLNPWQYMDEFDKNLALKRNKKSSRMESEMHHDSNLDSILKEERILETDEN